MDTKLYNLYNFIMYEYLEESRVYAVYDSCERAFRGNLGAKKIKDDHSV